MNLRSFGLIVILLMACNFTYHLSAQKAAEVGQGVLVGTSVPLRYSQQKVKKDERHTYDPRQVPNFKQKRLIATPFASSALPRGGDPLRNHWIERNGDLPSELLSFDGMDQEISEAFPPDPVGAVGFEHYVQMVNGGESALIQVFDLAGNKLSEPISSQALWSPFGLDGLGDPIVLYDRQVKRWVITELGQIFTNTYFVAVSKTEDPLGEYYIYKFFAPDLPDYPKYSIWHNGYYLTTNEIQGDHVPVYVLQRDAMLVGASHPSIIRLGVPKFDDNDAFQVTTPVDWDGAVPPLPNEPGYLVRIYDDAFEGGEDGLEVWTVKADWDEPENSTIEGPNFIPLAPFDADLCDGSIFNCLEQPGPEPLSALAQVVMFRAPYQNYGNYQSIVLNFSVDVSGDNDAGVRWLELRKDTDTPWALHQEGTVAPDSLSRFMGSISQDASGNILLAYSVVGAEKAASLRYTGRRVNDPLGMMTIPETEFATGSGTYDNSRWGDYSSFSLSPLDNRTLWFTGEYLDSSSWSTKIIALQLEREQLDIGLVLVESPQTSGDLDSAELVTIQVRNNGLDTLENYTVSYQLDGGMFVRQYIEDTLAPEENRLITFDSTIDLSDLREYNLLVAVSAQGDDLSSNDTLIHRIIHRPANDVILNEIIGLDNITCDSLIEFGVVIQNLGADTLRSVEMQVESDGELQLAEQFNVALPPYYTDTLIVDFFEAETGVHALKVALSSPNQQSDFRPFNNVDSTSFEVNTEEGLVGITVTLIPDSYPAETTWELRGPDGSVIDSGGPFDFETTNKEQVFAYCLPDTCFEYVIFDSFEDGMEPAVGNVSRLTIVNEDGTTLVRMGSTFFGNEISYDFCSRPRCDINANVRVINNESSPGAGNGLIRVQGENGSVPYEFSIDTSSYGRAPFISGISGGFHTVYIRDAQGCESSVTFFMPTCNLEIATEATGVNHLDSVNGEILVHVDGGTPPYQYGLNGLSYGPDSVFTDLGVGTYEVYVRDEEGCTGLAEAEIELKSSDSKFISGHVVKLFPNPTDGFLTIESKGVIGGPTMNYAILSNAGRRLFAGEIPRYGQRYMGRIPLHALPSGNYWIQLETARGVASYAIIKQ